MASCRPGPGIRAQANGPEELLLDRLRPAGNAFSSRSTGAGVLFVIDASAGTLWRVTP
jgi:hypothetical protein